MRVFLYFCILFVFLINPVKTVNSQITDQMSNKHITIVATSYPYYPPFSYIGEGINKSSYYSVFEKTLKNILLKNNISLSYKTSKNYEKNIETLKTNKVDIILGFYSENSTDIKIFDNVDYIYPAIVHNPIKLIMLPNNISKIQNTNDLPNLKGIYIDKEYFSDFIYNVFENYNIKPESDINIAYKKLFSGEVDFIIGSYYYHYIKSCELGLKNYISFSKKPLWSIPMFIGLSKKSKHYQRLKILLSKQMNNPIYSQFVEKDIKDYIQEFENKHKGVVPPTFILNKDVTVY